MNHSSKSIQNGWKYGVNTALQEEGQHDLLGFWSAVEELRRADRTLWHQLATEIFYGYVNKPTDDGAGVQGAMLSLLQFHFRSQNIHCIVNTTTQPTILVHGLLVKLDQVFLECRDAPGAPCTVPCAPAHTEGQSRARCSRLSYCWCFPVEPGSCSIMVGMPLETFN